VNALRTASRRVLELVDRVYRRSHRLTPVGPLLHVDTSAPAQWGPAPRGSSRDALVVGHLHIDNSRAAAVGAGTRRQSAVRVARLLRDSFAELAVRARNDARFRELPWYEGVTWFAPHGEAVGFESQPLAAGWRRRWLALHFRMLVWAFSASGDWRALEGLAPRRFRITREALIAHFMPPDRARS
jgi:hypothetical protein